MVTKQGKDGICGINGVANMWEQLLLGVQNLTDKMQ